MPSRSRRRSRQQSDAQGSAEVGNSQQSGRQGAPATGVRGWLAGAGRWISDRYDDTTEAVGGFVQRTGEAASDLWDIATTSDMSIQGGRLVLDTDLDELMDVMPGSVQSALQLDREASANRVNVVIDPSAKTAVLTSAEITVAGLDTESLKTGVVRLQGVRIVLSNPGGGVPFIDGDFGFLGFRDADDNLTADLSVAGLTAQDVVFQGADGPTTVSSVEVNGFSGTAAAQGGAPMGDDAKTNLDFSVEGAVLHGLAQQGLTVSRAAVGGASGGMYEGSETAFVAADALALQGVNQDGTSLGNATVSGARVDVQNQGGGLVGLDGKADRLSGRVRVATSTVSDFDGAGADFDSGSLAGVSVDFNSIAGTASARVDHASLEGLDTASVDANSASLTGLQGSLHAGDDKTTVRASADRAAMSGVQFDGAAGASGATSGPAGNLDWGVDIADVAVSDVSGAGVDVQGLNGTNVQASGFTGGSSDAWMMARADHAGLTGVDHELLQASSASVNGASLGWNARGDTTLQARDFAAADVSARNFAAADMSAAGANVTLAPSGNARSSLDHASVRGATIGGRMDVSEAQMSGVTATSIDGTREVGIHSASLSGVSDRVSGGSVGYVGLSDLQTVGNGQTTSAKAAEAHLSNGQFGGHRLDAASAQELSLSRDTAGAMDAGFGTVTASGIRGAPDGSGVGIETLDARDGRARLDGNGFGTSTLGSVSAAGIRTEAGTAATASLSDIAVDRSASGMRATGQSGRVDDIQFAGGGSIAAVTTEGVAAVQSNGRNQLGARIATASGIDVGGVTAEQASLQGGLLEQQTGSGVTSGRFDGLQASSVGVDRAGTQVGVSSVDARRGQFASGPGGPSASLERLQVQDAQVSTSGSGSGGGKADSAALLGSASRLLDDANITGSVGLNAGEAGPLTVRDGTTASGQIRIRDNHLDERNTRVDLSRALDGPLWTSVSGVSAGRDGRLEADVNGWGDKDLAPVVNESLGLSGKDFHSIGTMGSAIAASGGGSGGSGDSGLVDSSSLQLAGDASFRAGTLDAGQAGSVTLAERENAGQNKATFSADGRGQVVVGVADLLTRGFTTGGLSGGETRVQDAQVSSGGSGVDASAASIDARDLRFGTAASQ